MEMEDDSEAVNSERPINCTFFKKSKKNRNVRKRKVDDSGSEEDEGNVVFKKEKRTVPNPMCQKTDGFSKREREEEAIDVSFKSTRSAMREGPQDLGATATVEIDTDFDRDAQALFEKRLKSNEEDKTKESDDKRYKGMNNYMTFYEKKGTAQGNASSGMVRWTLALFTLQHQITNSPFFCSFTTNNDNNNNQALFWNPRSLDWFTEESSSRVNICVDTDKSAALVQIKFEFGRVRFNGNRRTWRNILGARREPTTNSIYWNEEYGVTEVTGEHLSHCATHATLLFLH